MTTITPPTEADLNLSPWMRYALAEQGARVSEVHDKSFFPVKGRPPGEQPWTDKKGNLYLLDRGILYDNENQMTRAFDATEPVEMVPYFKKSHQAIIKYGKSIKGDLFNPNSYSGAWRGDDIPWCSAFANWCVQSAGLKGTGKANARSWLGWGMETAQPFYGCVVVLWRGRRYGKSGHVAFFLKAEGRDVWLLGGNQAHSVCAQPYPRSRVLSYRHHSRAILPASHRRGVLA